MGMRKTGGEEGTGETRMPGKRRGRGTARRMSSWRVTGGKAGGRKENRGGENAAE